MDEDNQIKALRHEARTWEGFGHSNVEIPMGQLELLEEIRLNTAKTAFWTRVMGAPVLVGFIWFVFAVLLKECA